VKKPGFENDSDPNLAINDPSNYTYTYRGPAEKYIFSGDDNQFEGNEAGITMGQIFDQLNTLELGGYENLYGMITNGNTWMMIQNNQGQNFEPFNDNNVRRLLAEQLPSSNGISPDKFDPIFEENAPAIEVISSNNSDDQEEQIDKTTPNRILTASQPLSVTQSPEQCIYLIREFIWRAYERLNIRCAITGIRSCRVLWVIPKGNLEGPKTKMDPRTNPNMFAFQRVNLKRISKDLSKLITFNDIYQQTKQIFLIKNIGAGEFGDCCLAMDSVGVNFCAVKFFVPKNTSESEKSEYELARDEHDTWIEIYPELEKHIHLGNISDDKGFLCMPYLKPLKTDERQLVISNQSLLEALQEFVKKPFVHKVVSWRHIGTLNGNIYFLDFGRDGLEDSPTDEGEKQKWVSKNYERLQQRAGGPKEDTPAASSEDDQILGASLEHSRAQKKRKATA
jgi:hypothetical protein